jgi:hypothetical protein
MKELYVLAILLIICCTLTVVSANSDKEFEKGIILELEELDYDSSDPKRVKKKVEEYQKETIKILENKKGVKVIGSSWISNYIHVSLNKTKLSRDELLDVRKVDKITRNIKYKAPKLKRSNTLEVKKNREYSYGLNMLNVPEVWKKYDNRGEGVDITLLDTGINTSTVGLNDLDGWKDFHNYTREKPVDAGPFLGHGTMVSSILIGEDNSGKHIGVVPEADLTVGRVCDSDASCYRSEINAGIEWSIIQGTDVISLSLGTSRNRGSFLDSIDKASEYNVTVVVAIGNSGKGTSRSPGNYYNVISVGSVGKNREVSSFSSGEVVDKKIFNNNWYTKRWPSNYIVPDVVAPGEDITVPAVGGQSFGTTRGTSLSTPYVTGIVALMIKENDYNRDTDKIKKIIKQVSSKPDKITKRKDVRYGYGIPNAQKAVELYSGDTKYITGKVKDTKNNQISNARLSFNNMSVSTDQNGKFGFYILDDTEYINISKEGYDKKLIDRKELIKKEDYVITLNKTFTKPLIPSFDSPPKNTKQIDNELYEDLNGDGNGINTNQTVEVFGKLIRNQSLNINGNPEKLNWDPESPRDKVTKSDMIELFEKQIEYNQK